MSDSDDSGPLSQQARSKKFSSRSTTKAAHETLTLVSESENGQSSTQMTKDIDDLPAMTTELRAKLATKRSNIRNEALQIELKTKSLRSALTKQEDEYREIEAKLKNKGGELQLTTTELFNLEKAQATSKQLAPSSKEQAIYQATKDFEDFEHLAQELPARLNRTAFDSKISSILTIFRSFHQDILKKHFTDHDELQLPSMMPSHNRAHPPLNRSQHPLPLNPSAKQKLTSVLHGLRNHRHYRTFAQPVTEAIAPIYFAYIRHPMDVSTMRAKLDADNYGSVDEFVADARLMLDNCRVYNGRESEFAERADAFERLIWGLMARRGFVGF